MVKKARVDAKDIDEIYNRLNREAEQGGYYLNPDVEFTKDLINGLLVNEQRYGYWSCPCRLAVGEKREDIDIICPCDYRDADLNEYGSCYCALYVTRVIKEGEKQAESIPERRPENRKERSQFKLKKPQSLNGDKELPYPVWRCKVCGYLCARDTPPEVCPVCKAKRERFEQFLK